MEWQTDIEHCSNVSDRGSISGMIWDVSYVVALFCFHEVRKSPLYDKPTDLPSPHVPKPSETIV
jgi:hypothetical protein